MTHRLVQLLSGEEISQRLMEVESKDQHVIDSLYPLIVKAAADKEKCAEGISLCVINPILQLRLTNRYFHENFDLTMLLFPAWIRCLTNDEEIIIEALRFYYSS